MFRVIYAITKYNNRMQELSEQSNIQELHTPKE